MTFLFSITCQKYTIQTLAPEIKKGGLTIAEYLLKIKNITHALASAGHIVFEEDQILHVFSGLGTKYMFLLSHSLQE